MRSEGAEFGAISLDIGHYRSAFGRRVPDGTSIFDYDKMEAFALELRE
jgi:hypothetical protein